MNESDEHHILVVSDDILSSSTLKEHLELRGYRVTAAIGSDRALAALRYEDPVDLMILDQETPHDLLRTMAEEEALQKPNVIMSGMSDPCTPVWETLGRQLPQTAQGLIKACVNKPYSLSMMDAMVNLLLSASPPRPSGAKEVLSGDYQLESPRAPLAEIEVKSPL